MLMEPGAPKATITTGEAAELLGWSIDTVATAADAGLLGRVRHTPGGHRRLDRGSVERYAETGSATADAAPSGASPA